MIGRAFAAGLVVFAGLLSGCGGSDPIRPKPPSLQEVTPASFGAGDTITLIGTGFHTLPSGNSVYVGGVLARVLAGTTTSLVVQVPACVEPGDVAVKVQVGRSVSNSLMRTHTATSPQLALNVLEGITLTGADGSSCLRLPGDGAQYLVVPQFVGDSTLARFGYFLGASGTFTAQPAFGFGRRIRAHSDRNATPRAFERMLRMRERELAPKLAFAQPVPSAHSARLQALTIGSTRAFKVLGNLSGTTFRTANAQLKYIGENVLLYFDVETPAGGFSDAEIFAFGELFDKTLYDLAERTFGTTSDIDANGHIAVLFSPYINALTPSAKCSTEGFVTGYFFGFDLDSQSPNSNKGEVFYSLTPDPNGTRSCVHTVEQVKKIVPATFIHELQHMISFNQHVIVRGGEDEEIWLNEGLSHIAEEVASRYYESRCAGVTTPPCRTNPSSMFPDSAVSFISGDLIDAYDYLRDPASVSVTTFKDFATLEERGAAWLFLRWLGDQKDSTIYGRLVQTKLTGIANVEDKSGESFASLFGDFSIATYTDSIPGVARTAVPLRYRFVSRNFRQIYNTIYNLNPGLLPAPFPITLKTVPQGGLTSSMVQGTMDHFLVQTASGSGGVSLQFSTPDRKPFPPTLEAQLGVFRLPSSPPASP